MLSHIDGFYLEKEEPVRSCLMSTRAFILGLTPDITESWKYGMPFFCYDGKMLCYLWTRKNSGPTWGSWMVIRLIIRC
jgi:hypothetical protein